MASSIDLNVWARPSNRLDGDHTWVTSYSTPPEGFPDGYPAIEAVPQGDHFWYCWGAYHPEAEYAVATAAADLAFAKCLVEPDHHTGRGTIRIYGIHGVCHQVANQVLYTTAVYGHPLTVDGANGYPASRFCYGPYGRRRRAWEKQIASCRAAGAPDSEHPGHDEIRDLFDQTFGPASDQPEGLEKVKMLLEIRTEFERHADEAAQIRNAGHRTEALDEGVNIAMELARQVLGDAGYKAMFGLPPGVPVRIIDPEMVELSLRMG